MAVARKPKPQKPADVEKLIDRGLSVQDDPPSVSETTSIPLRLSRDLLTRIDTAVKAQPLKTSRNRWILQALLSQLDQSEIK